MDVNETTSTKSKQKQFDPKLKEQLRKEGINPDMISEYGDVDFEDHVDDAFCRQPPPLNPYIRC